MSERARLIVIINNAAARSRRAWPEVREALASGGVGFDAHESVRPGETEERTRAALREGYRTVAVVGGDGTLSAAASGYFYACDTLQDDELPRPVNPSAALAVIPAGTGDDFARGLTGGRREPLCAWVERLARHARANESDDVRVERHDLARRVDVLAGSVDGGSLRFICLNAATLGIGAEVAARVGAQAGAVRRLSGEARFAWAAVQSLAAWRGRRVRIEVDGAEWVECRTNLIAVVNGPYAGGGMNFSPEASVSDGLLDVLTVRDIGRAGLVRELTRVHSGGHLANPKVILKRGTRVRIGVEGEKESLPLEADGDVRGRTPAEFRVVPSALRVVY